MLPSNIARKQNILPLRPSFFIFKLKRHDVGIIVDGVAGYG